MEIIMETVLSVSLMYLSSMDEQINGYEYPVPYNHSVIQYRCRCMYVPNTLQSDHVIDLMFGIFA